MLRFEGKVDDPNEEQMNKHVIKKDLRLSELMQQNNKITEVAEEELFDNE